MGELLGREKLLVELTETEKQDLEWLLKRVALEYGFHYRWAPYAYCYDIRHVVSMFTGGIVESTCTHECAFVVQLKTVFMFTCRKHVASVVKASGRIVISV